mgnify:CR=1 FL=1|jgi:hypothetical protein
MTNQKLLDKMTREGNYQNDVIRIAQFFLEHGFVLSKICKGFVILKRESSEKLELIICLHHACEYKAHSMDGKTVSVILNQPSKVQFVD